MNKLEWTDQDRRKVTLLHHVFHQTPEGRELLGLLVEEYLMRPSANYQAPEYHIHIREGENNMVRLFKQAKNLMIKLQQENNTNE